MKKAADSNLDMGNAFRVRNVPGTQQDQDAISRGECNERYQGKTTTLNNIPLANGHVDLNGYKIINSQPLSIFDLNPGTQQQNTLTTIDWVENRAGVYRDQANTYSDGRLAAQYIQLHGQIAAVDAKKVNYTDGIDSMAIAKGDYNMGLYHLFNLPSAVLPDQAVRYDQLTSVMDQTYTKT